MLIKIKLPTDAKILRNENNEIVINTPVSHETILNIFSIEDTNGLEENGAIDWTDILIASNGKIEIKNNDEENGDYQFYDDDLPEYGYEE